MNRNINVIASIGLATGALFGMSGIAFSNPTIQIILFVISGWGFTTGLALLAIKFLREKSDLIACGFFLFAIGEAVSTLTAAADEKTSASAFAGCMLFYTVGFLLILFNKKFALWTRITGLTSALLFFIAASRFYLGYGISSNDTLPGIAYGLLTVTLIGFILYLVKEQPTKETMDVAME